MRFVTEQGEPLLRERIKNKIETIGFLLENLINPNFHIPESIRIGKGVVIQNGCFILCNVVIEDNVLLQINVLIGHDCKLKTVSIVSSSRNLGGNTETVKPAKEKFWNGIHDFIAKKYTVEPIIHVDKLTMDYYIAIENEGVKLEKDVDNLFNRINVYSLDLDLSAYACLGESYIEIKSETLDELKKAVNKKFQTQSYFGGNAKKYADWVINNRLSGIDRIVPIDEYCAYVGLKWEDEKKKRMYNIVKNLGKQIIFAKGRNHYVIATCVCSLADAIFNQRLTIASVTSPLKGEFGISTYH